MITNIIARNLLSFSDCGAQVTLGNLNILIGSNGAGKSNLIEVLNLLRSAANGNLLSVIREGGGISEWIHKRSSAGNSVIPISNITVSLPFQEGKEVIYELNFTEFDCRFGIVSEIIKCGIHNYSRYSIGEEKSIFFVDGKETEIEIDRTESILSYIKNPESYPEIAFLGKEFSKILIYRGFEESILRQTQSINDQNKYLKEDGSNLPLVLNFLRRDPLVKRKIIQNLGELYNEVEDFDVRIEGSSVQVYLIVDEGERVIPSPRISGGILRYMSLLAILCNTNDESSIVCIEHPEMGLHFDVLPKLAELIEEASENRQLIITTHSDVFLNSISNKPGSIVVVEKNKEVGTTFKRLKVV